MSQSYDVTIVSAWGRGQWLSARLAELGFKVALVDVSDNLGRWTPTDWEGPFGYFQGSSLTQSQVERLTEDEYLDPVEEGFSLWLKNGPRDFKGPLSGYWSGKFSQLVGSTQYLGSYLQLEPSESESIKSYLTEKDYSENWIVNLAHQLSATTYKENIEGLSFGRPLPLMSDYYIRRTSRRGYKKSLDWCEQKGVKLFSGAQLEDIRIEGNSCTALEIKSDWSGAISSDQFIWMLSSEETKFASQKVAKVLYPQGELKSMWSWLKFGVQLSENEASLTLPMKFVLIEDLNLPWTHLNMCLMQRSEQSSQYDVWMKVPTQQRFSKDYLDKLFVDLKTVLENRIPGTEVSLWTMPQDYLYNYEDLGPSPFVQFNEEQRDDWKSLDLGNLTYKGPEHSQSWDWTGQMFEHREILNSFRAKDVE
ncbi:MAG: hypothetical protein HOO06_12225 [Bdellovibrionaceae bacterium]|jgi:hypothetical protein|nr:hypothetical protein [Pseudobdellovibrionaceae bacterium]